MICSDGPVEITGVDSGKRISSIFHTPSRNAFILEKASANPSDDVGYQALQYPIKFSHTLPLYRPARCACRVTHASICHHASMDFLFPHGQDQVLSSQCLSTSKVITTMIPGLMRFLSNAKLLLLNQNLYVLLFVHNISLTASAVPLQPEALPPSASIVLCYFNFYKC